MKMTAAVMYEQGLATPYRETEPFKIEEVDLEGPREGEVLVEVRAGGLCHSDLSQVAGQRKRSVPVVGGHEGAGIVREVGRGVPHLRPGDHVVMTGATGCGQCKTCRAGRPNLCDVVRESRSHGYLGNGAARLSREGTPIYHYSGISSFAQYAVTLPESLITIDPSVPLEAAALFGCGVVTGAGSVFNAARVRPGDTVVVFGLGGVGLSAVMAAKISGASKIIGIDVVDAKLPLARELGCTHTFLATEENLVETIKDLTGGGVDFAFEVSGNKRAMASAVDLTRRGGEIVCVGLGALEDLYEYSHARLVVEEKTFRGSAIGSGNAIVDIPRYLQFFVDGQMPVDLLMSGTMTFGDLNASLDLLDRGIVTREVLLPHAA